MITSNNLTENIGRDEKLNLSTPELEYQQHYFPANYCEKAGIDRELWNSVINKTPIYARTNRIIGGYAPSQYLSSLERNHQATPELLNQSLESHQIDVESIRNDDFNSYFEKRYNSLLNLIENATGKPVSGREEKTVPLTLFDLAESEVVED